MATVRKERYVYKGRTKDRFVVDYKDAKGKRREKSFHNKRHADEHLQKVQRELHEDVHTADRATITFAKACRAWLDHCESRHRSKNRTMAGGSSTDTR